VPDCAAGVVATGSPWPLADGGLSLRALKSLHFFFGLPNSVQLYSIRHADSMRAVFLLALLVAATLCTAAASSSIHYEIGNSARHWHSRAHRSSSSSSPSTDTTLTTGTTPIPQPPPVALQTFNELTMSTRWSSSWQQSQSSSTGTSSHTFGAAAGAAVEPTLQTYNQLMQSSRWSSSASAPAAVSSTVPASLPVLNAMARAHADEATKRGKWAAAKARVARDSATARAHALVALAASIRASAAAAPSVERSALSAFSVEDDGLSALRSSPSSASALPPAAGAAAAVLVCNCRSVNQPPVAVAAMLCDRDANLARGDDDPTAAPAKNLASAKNLGAAAKNLAQAALHTLVRTCATAHPLMCGSDYAVTAVTEANVHVGCARGLKR
jgi:hypothetical protein